METEKDQLEVNAQRLEEKQKKMSEDISHLKTEKDQLKDDVQKVEEENKEISQSIEK